MSTDLVVRARQARDLTTARLRTLLSSIGQEAGLRLSLVGEAVGIRVTLALAPDHADAFELLLARVGARLTLTTRCAGSGPCHQRLHDQGGEMGSGARTSEGGDEDT